MTRLLLIRHAESEWNAEKRWQGRADPPLSETGRVEAKRAAQALRGEIDRVVASPQMRARDTAQIIADELGLDVVRTDERLCEVDVGEFSGLNAEEVEARFSREAAAWRTRDLDVRPPGGETRREMLERVVPALERIASDEGRILVLTHGGVIATLERVSGCEITRGVRHLQGRWFEVTDEIRAVGERVSLIGDEHEPTAEAR